MAPPPIALFMTTIASQISLRSRQEYILRTLQVKKIPYTTYDLASDEDAKRLWRRKAPADKQQLPGILVGGKFPGTFAEFEDAVEHGELDIFLRRNDEWDPSIDEDRPMPEVKPVGVPGAMTPLQMTPDHLKKKILAGSPSPSPLKAKGIPVNKRTDEFDVGEKLSGYGLQGVKVTEDDLLALINELGLAGDDAGDLVKGLSDISISGSSSKKAPKAAEKAEAKAAEKAQEPVKAESQGAAVEAAKETEQPKEAEPVKESEIVKEAEPVKESEPVKEAEPTKSEAAKSTEPIKEVELNADAEPAKVEEKEPATAEKA